MSENKKTLLKGAHNKMKSENFNFAKIERYFSGSKKDDLLQIISDRTYQDLDLEDVFKLVDRTTSLVGQQYLYNLLRTIPANNNRSEKLEHLISVFKEKPGLKEQVLNEISGLQHNNAYYITSLFLDVYIKKPKWFWIVRLLSIVSVCSVLLAFVFPQIFIFLIFLLPVNFGFHYWNKNNLYQYGASIPQLLILNKIAKKISKFEELGTGDSTLHKSIKMLDILGIPMSIFKLEARLQSEVGQLIEYVIEIVKALFLIEPIILFEVLPFLDSRRQHIAAVFDFVGEIDAALSIHFLREDLPYYAIPEITSGKKVLNMQSVYHPLIFNAISNDISLNKKSVLLTGSNMSGKTTFIRTIAINAILAQSINTCFAKQCTVPRVKVHSAIQISDDLLSEKSYYFEEVLTIKNLLKESESGFENLFLLDELFKGTNSVERIAAGKSVLDYLNKGNNIVFVSTHDLELADYLNETFDLYHFTEVIENNDILFDYKIKPGNLVTTNAIRILALNNYPAAVVDEASRLSQEIKKIKISTSKRET